MELKTPRFVKWAGGKNQLLEQFSPFFPTNFNRYLEPFVGSGAVFFFISQKYDPMESVLSDTNKELITAYTMVKDNVKELITELRKHKLAHHHQGKPYYLKIRSINPEKLTPLEKAARFIYLNKTCFNGLYRVNSKGHFNVPMGRYTNPDIVQEEKLLNVSKLLRKVTVLHQSFDQVIHIARKGDFVYLDPPYYPLKKGKSFTTYTANTFLEKEHKLLATVFKKLDNLGCHAMLSNSDTSFVRSLYSNYNINVVQAKRMINCDSDKRGLINEVVITNYEVPR